MSRVGGEWGSDSSRVDGRNPCEAAGADNRCPFQSSYQNGEGRVNFRVQKLAKLKNWPY
jgi:hypothetical protein